MASATTAAVEGDRSGIASTMVHWSTQEYEEYEVSGVDGSPSGDKATGKEVHVTSRGGWAPAEDDSGRRQTVAVSIAAGVAALSALS